MNKDDFGTFIKDMAFGMAHSQAEALRTGCELTEKRYSRALIALRAAYEAALLDPKCVLTTPLTAAICAALAIHEQDRTNIYANANIKRDQETPKHERGVRQGAKDTPVGS